MVVEGVRSTGGPATGRQLSAPRRHPRPWVRRQGTRSASQNSENSQSACGVGSARVSRQLLKFAEGLPMHQARGPSSRLSTLGGPWSLRAGGRLQAARPRARSGRGARVAGPAGPSPRAGAGWRGEAGTGERRRGHLRGAARPQVLSEARRLWPAARGGGAGRVRGGGRRPRGFPEAGGGAGGLGRRGGRTRPLPPLPASSPARTRSRRGSGMGAARAHPAPTPV